MADLEIIADEMEGLQDLMNSAEYNTQLVANGCQDCGEYGCLNRECTAAGYDLPKAPAQPDAWQFIVCGG